LKAGQIVGAGTTEQRRKILEERGAFTQRCFGLLAIDPEMRGFRQAAGAGTASTIAKVAPKQKTVFFR